MAIPSVNPFSQQPGGGFGMVVDRVNAVRKNMYDNQIKQSEAEYAPWTNYSNALSKTAYAQYRPAEIAAQMMLSPAFRQLSREQQSAMIGHYANQLNNPMGGNMPAPNTPSRSDNVFSMLMKNLTGSNNNQPSNPMADNSMGGGGGNVNAFNANPNAGYADNAGQGQGNGMIGSQTPSAGQIAGQTTPGSAGGYGAVDAAEDQAAAAKIAATGQQSNQNEQQKARSLAISNQATVANQAAKTLEAWYRNYGKSSYRGQYAGSAPASGKGSIPTLPGANASPEQLADSYSNQYLTQLSALGDTPAGKTDAGREIIASGKVHRALDDDAAKELYESQKAGLHRMVKSRDFANDFYKNNPGATDEQLVAMMNLYNENAPSYDYEKGKPLPENDKKFRDFTSRQALQTYIQDGDYNPYGKSENEKPSQKPVEGVIEATIDMDGKSYHMINGKYYEDVK